LSVTAKKESSVDDFGSLLRVGKLVHPAAVKCGWSHGMVRKNASLTPIVFRSSGVNILSSYKNKLDMLRVGESIARLGGDGTELGIDDPELL
jgi:hypothetical protein